MGTTNFGNQTISFDYGEAGRSLNFNRLNYKVLPTGIYDGFLISRVSDVEIQISTGTCIIYDSSKEIAVKVSTSNTQNLDVAVGSPERYIIFRMAWTDTDNNYMDMLVVEFADILSTDLIVGKINYTSTTLDTDMDYSLRSNSLIKVQDDINDYFKVTPSDPISNILNIEAGSAFIANKYVVYAGGTYSYTSPADDTTLGRIDVVYMDSTGTVSKIKGTDAGSPTVPDLTDNILPLAIITRGASRTNIKGSEIAQVFPLYNRGGGFSDYTVGNSSGNVPISNGTVCTNLNADKVDGYSTSESSTPSTVVARDASGNITGNVLVSDVAIGTPPLTVTSTTKVTNLNADKLDDLDTATASTASTVATRDASGNITGKQLISDVADGTAPLTVTSTSKVTNLNADLLDGFHASELASIPELIGSEQTLVNVSDITVDTTYNILLECTDKTSIGDSSAYTRAYLVFFDMTTSTTGASATTAFNFIAGATGSTNDSELYYQYAIVGSIYNKKVVLLLPHGRYQMMVDITNTGGTGKFSLLIKAKEIKFASIVYADIV